MRAKRKYFCQTCGAEIGISFVITCDKVFCTSKCGNEYLNKILGERNEKQK